MRIEKMTTVELSREIERDPVLIIPVGATEAHGPHLPLGTDSLQPEAIADMLAARINGLVAPPIRYGHHSSTKNMVGTIGISFDTLRALVREVMESLIKDGIQKIVVLSGHAGQIHMAALKAAAEDVVRETDAKIMLLTDYDLAWEVTDEMGVKEDGHGGLVETSRIMDIAGDLVGDERGTGTFIDQEFMVIARPEACFPQGYAGPAEDASPALGRRINDHVVNRLEGIINRRWGV